MARPVVLQTERLLLRPYQLNDVDAILAYACDPSWSRFLPAVPENYARSDAERFIAQSVLIDWDTHPRWAMVHEGTVSGGVDLRVDDARNIAELGYSLAPWLWGRGLTVEGAGAAIDWAFPEFGLAKIAAFADARNRQSWRVMEKLGMQREGVLRSARIHRGERFDEAWYGLLRAEWESRARR